MIATFESAYKALEAAKAAAEEAAQRGLETGDPKVIDLARENLSRATNDFHKALELDSVEIETKNGKVKLLRAEFLVLEKLAKDNNRNVSEFTSRVTVESGRVINADFSSLGLKNISALSSLTELTALRLVNNQIVDISALTKLTKLRKLELSENQIVDISPIAKITNLTRLGLERNKVIDINHLAQLSELRQLWLDYNQIVDISVVSNFRMLKKLNAWSNPLQKNPKLITLIDDLRARGCIVWVDL